MAITHAPVIRIANNTVEKRREALRSTVLAEAPFVKAGKLAQAIATEARRAAETVQEGLGETVGKRLEDEPANIVLDTTKSIYSGIGEIVGKMEETVSRKLRMALTEELSEQAAEGELVDTIIREAKTRMLAEAIVAETIANVPEADVEYESNLAQQISNALAASGVSDEEFATAFGKPLTESLKFRDLKYDCIKFLVGMIEQEQGKFDSLVRKIVSDKVRSLYRTPQHQNLMSGAVAKAIDVENIAREMSAKARTAIEVILAGLKTEIVKPVEETTPRIDKTLVTPVRPAEALVPEIRPPDELADAGLLADLGNEVVARRASWESPTPVVPVRAMTGAPGRSFDESKDITIIQGGLSSFIALLLETQKKPTNEASLARTFEKAMLDIAKKLTNNGIAISYEDLKRFVSVELIVDDPNRRNSTLNFQRFVTGLSETTARRISNELVAGEVDA